MNKYIIFISTVSILKRKWRLREAEWLSQGHMASRCQSQALNPHCQALEPLSSVHFKIWPWGLECPLNVGSSFQRKKTHCHLNPEDSLHRHYLSVYESLETEQLGHWCLTASSINNKPNFRKRAEAFCRRQSTQTADPWTIVCIHLRVDFFQ